MSSAGQIQSDKVSRSERFGQLIPLAGTALVIIFFAIHQLRPTGFFTAEYGIVAQAVLYGILVVGAVPFVARIATGSKKATKPYEMVAMAVSFVGMLYLLIVFPFNFEYFAAPLPASLEFLLDWVPSLLGWAVLAVGVLGSGACMAVNLVQYLSKKKLAEIAEKCQAGETSST
jgi:hypothetical protein